MAGLVPKNKPMAKREEIEKWAKDIKIKQGDAVVVVAVRGYFLDSMGKPGVNDRLIYDDALFILSPTTFSAFNANVDPGAFRKRIASIKALKSGQSAYRYKKGTHGNSKPAPLRYQAFVQNSNVTVVRDQIGDDTGRFGINIHRGGKTKVSSIGCLTLPPEQWEGFKGLLNSELARHARADFPLIVIDFPGNKA